MEDKTMNKLLLGTTCAAVLFAAGSAGAIVTIVPADANAPAASTDTAISPSTGPAAAPPASPEEHVGRWHRACDADVRRFCGGITSKPAITACLDRNTDKLSPECKAIRGEEERRWRREHEHRRH